MLRAIHNSAKELRRHKKKDGSLIDVEVTRCEVLFNGCLADIVVAVDVTGHLPVPTSVHGTQVPTDRRPCGGPLLSQEDAPLSRLKSA
jgi:hypothetical protein